MFGGCQENDKVLKIYCAFISKSFHIHFNSSQMFFLISLLHSLVKVTNEGLIACKCFRLGNGEVFSFHTLSIYETWNKRNIVCNICHTTTRYNCCFVSIMYWIRMTFKSISLSIFLWTRSNLNFQIKERLSFHFFIVSDVFLKEDICYNITYSFQIWKEYVIL